MLGNFGSGYSCKLPGSCWYMSFKSYLNYLHFLLSLSCVRRSFLITSTVCFQHDSSFSSYFVHERHDACNCVTKLLWCISFSGKGALHHFVKNLVVLLSWNCTDSYFYVRNVRNDQSICKLSPTSAVWVFLCFSAHCSDFTSQSLDLFPCPATRETGSLNRLVHLTKWCQRCFLQIVLLPPCDQNRFMQL